MWPEKQTSSIESVSKQTNTKQQQSCVIAFTCLQNEHGMLTTFTGLRNSNKRQTQKQCSAVDFRNAFATVATVVVDCCGNLTMNKVDSPRKLVM
jgi:hypothetical protein